MSASIRRLLDFARLEPAKRHRRDLAELAGEAVELLAPLAASQEIALTCLPPREPAPAEVADASLQQVLANLIVNAFHACQAGGHVRLETGVARERTPPGTFGRAADWAYVRVLDDGAGISEEDMPHLFEPFFATKDIGAGTGLGLSLLVPHTLPAA